ncbi:hypothetical protein BDQ12DRAFT_685759 [Crucibulum laeve]|uniref:Uncharacterized protein n=1 Tax=Crucibulum laeve TaxID=68775 RepID=A0A5C3LWG6_9AGAR|nr:hypothetical protein BDQ12DRAFT_685759 [Crucibulum laeve]
MDTDPLADTVPPRYAIESDEEEDEVNPLHLSRNDNESQVEVKFIGDVPSERNLIIATGDAGKVWARGASLGEQTGAVMVNGVQIGLVFSPFWTKSNVIVSEALSRLPVWAMHKYAQNIIDTLKPTSSSLLDSYPVPSYVTNQPTSYDNAPLRYLSTSATDAFGDQAQQFSPPNLIQSTSASFLTIFSVANLMGFLVLLPSPHIPHPAPKAVSQSNYSQLSQDDVDWPSSTLTSAHELLFKVVGEPIKQKWEPKNAPGTESTPRKRGDVGEGGMYI